jgi:hypothetical protein
MDLDGAIQAHEAWRLKFLFYLVKKDGSMNPDSIGRDHRCELGKWLHGDGKKYSWMPEYATLLKLHARFHRAAADVVSQVNSSDAAGKEIAVGEASAFAAASEKLEAAIKEMKRKTSRE